MINETAQQAHAAYKAAAGQTGKTPGEYGFSWTVTIFDGAGNVHKADVAVPETNAFSKPYSKKELPRGQETENQMMG